MRYSRQLILVLLLLFFPVLAGSPAPVFACSCAPPPPPAEALEQATAVFAGTVTNIDIPGGTIISTADPVAITFQVETVWKGPVEPTLLVTTARDSASCGYHFDLNQSYLVYAYGSERSLETNLCSRTTRLSPILEDLVVLGEGTTPPAVLVLPESPVMSLPLLLFGLLAILLGLLGPSLNRRLGIGDRERYFTVPHFRQTAKWTTRLGQAMLLLLGAGLLMQAVGGQVFGRETAVFLSYILLALAVLCILTMIGLTLRHWRA
ncbi:MAG: hypothetical protein R6X32_01490 [Chloroflexota bacterium]